MVKKFEEYFNNIEEVLNNPVDIKWAEKQNELSGEFTLNDDVYFIRCVQTSQ